MRKLIWAIALLLAAACTTDRKPQEEVVGSAVCFDNWDRLEEKLVYFKELIDLQDSAIAGQEISIQHLQALMPQNEVDFVVFMATERYAIIKEGDVDVESPRALFLMAGEMAIADTLDMMEQYLKWFDWSESEVVWNKAIGIEKLYPKKFDSLMQNNEWYDAWKEYRDDVLEYEKASKE